ncbi:MAG: DUF365 domain-containing protein [Methanocalculus sp. MSAO_Arc2]|uniref:DUF365 domain-containing protein n=1 Tax=Methanocalculus TaxID=71151 RepID=UPI000FEF467A|nr:DUF365 domain-containing protein [Methanocalculus sp. AMF5]MCP1662118.1 hypothetical protein [Methanocalculus sp. AMF5]RQD83403.1 MAG: DUF365 domain-containing protein [Methanocalculus sp. MSAO_Arc2]
MRTDETTLTGVTNATSVTGVTFPVPKQYMHRFFSGGKTVFVKPATVFKELRRGMRLVFYQSHEDTGYVGEATIRRILIAADPLTFYDTYGDAVFLTRDEMVAYLENQERWKAVRVRKGKENENGSENENVNGSENKSRKRDWMALELEDIRAYRTVQKPERFVPVGGQYLRD